VISATELFPPFGPCASLVSTTKVGDLDVGQEATAALGLVRPLKPIAHKSILAIDGTSCANT
jgi:hypothetical protein